MKMTREEAIKELQKCKWLIQHCGQDCLGERDIPLLDMAIESLSAEPNWITDRKPIEDGKYMVTVKGVVCDRFVDMLFYGKPLMPNREVKGMCWYDSDDEWGDIVYANTEILAWMPLPEPYREDGEV